MNTLQLQTILYQKSKDLKITTTAKELANMLDVSAQTVKQHIKKLVADKIITKVIEAPGSPNTFVLKPLPKEQIPVLQQSKNDKPQKKPTTVPGKATLRQDTQDGLWWIKLSGDYRFNPDNLRKHNGSYTDPASPGVNILGPFQTEDQAEAYSKQQRLVLID